MALIACLDTRFYFAYVDESQSWTRKIVDQTRHAGSKVVSSTVSIAELLRFMGADVGVETTKLRIVSMKSAGIMFVPVSEEISSMAGELALRDRELPLADALIAVTALEETHGRLYTDDPHFKQIPGIQTVWGKL
jgi:predicted nucleic acid-binding protein